MATLITNQKRIKFDNDIPLLYAWVHNSICNEPIPRVNALHLNLYVALIAQASISRTTQPEFASVTELARLIGYSRQSVPMLRQALSSKVMRQLIVDKIEFATKGASKGRITITLDKAALSATGRGRARVPLRLPSKSAQAAKLFLWLCAWPTDGSHRIDGRKLSTIIGIKAAQSPAGMFRDLVSAQRVMNRHLKTLDRNALREVGIDLPYRFAMRREGKVWFVPVWNQALNKRMKRAERVTEAPPLTHGAMRPELRLKAVFEALADDMGVSSPAKAKPVDVMAAQRRADLTEWD